MQHDSGQPASRPGQPESCVCSYLACNLLHLVLWYLEAPCSGRTDSLLVRQDTCSLDTWEKRENFIGKNLIDGREPKVLGSVKIILVTSSWIGVSWDQEAISTLPSTPSFVAVTCHLCIGSWYLSFLIRKTLSTGVCVACWTVVWIIRYLWREALVYKPEWLNALVQFC